MTAKEALEDLCQDCRHYPCYALKNEDHCLSMNTILQVIDKNIPKTPITSVKRFQRYDNLGELVVKEIPCKTCPTCGEMLKSYETGWDKVLLKYSRINWICPNPECRQAILQNER